MATTTETYVPNQLYFILLALLHPNPNQPCKYFDPHPGSDPGQAPGSSFSRSGYISRKFSV